MSTASSPPAYSAPTSTTAQPTNYNLNLYGGNTTVQTQPPPYSGGVQAGAPGVGYGNATMTLQPGTYVIGTTAATTMSPLSVARDPTGVTCQYCNKAVVTRVEYVNGQAVTCCALIICLMGGWCGCCLIPCCSNTYKDADHYCPECSMKLGTALPGGHNRAGYY